MSSSRSERLGLIGALLALLAGCESSPPCLRHSDCASGTMCIAGECVVPARDGGELEDAAVLDAAVTSDGAIDGGPGDAGGG